MSDILALNIDNIAKDTKVEKSSKNGSNLDFLNILLSQENSNFSSSLTNLDLKNPLNSENFKSEFLTKSLISKENFNSNIESNSNLNTLKKSKSLDDILKSSNKIGLNLSKVEVEKLNEKGALKISAKNSKEITNQIQENLNFKISKESKEQNIELKDLNTLNFNKKEITAEKLGVNLENQVKNGTLNNSNESKSPLNLALNNLNLEKNSSSSKVKERNIKEIDLTSLLQSKNSKDSKAQDIAPILAKTLSNENDKKVVDRASREVQKSKVELNSLSQGEVEFKNRIIDAKESIKSFTTTLKEQVENYKPPLMKLNLSLNPKELGNVDITLLNRGNSLHINLSSNHQAMQLFAQNQGEFRNSLTNIGFENVDMSFNSNSNGSNQGDSNSQNRERAFQNYANSSNFNLSAKEEIDSIDLIIPQYV